MKQHPLAYLFILNLLVLIACNDQPDISEMHAISKGDNNILILMYHDIVDPNNAPAGLATVADDVTLQNFQKQLDWLQANGYQTISAYDLYNLRANNRRSAQKQVLITFDDNYYGAYEYAVPELEKRGMKATFFAHTQYVRPEGIVPDYAGLRPKASWAEMVAVETTRGKGNLFRYESHTVTHRNLTKLGSAELRQELCASKRDIERNFARILGSGRYRGLTLGNRHINAEGDKLVRHIAYPVGGYNGTVGSLSKECGYFLGYEVGFAEDFELSSMALPRLGVGRSLATVSDFQEAVANYVRQVR
ncbi:MAG TPA: polysaccharide deacetylase family protein [Oligoflexus sp.]|uniref:polysaccharide deacetylase family protein n=1 Tax=Oligoflexus sp. TaxID=1971216 RepID=UPI002D3D8B7C|nr:polysaccharide deacetylase family protein [Oligoflexus sp.]HYX36187.1 polysaccharide deacetylase family protein [Oligoflexus sp.]